MNFEKLTEPQTVHTMHILLEESDLGLDFMRNFTAFITQGFLEMEFPKYGIRELHILRHEIIPQTHVQAILLTGNAWLFNEKKIS